MSHIRVFEIKELHIIIIDFTVTSSLIALALAFPVKSNPESPFVGLEVEIERRAGVMLNSWSPYPEFFLSLAGGHAIVAGRTIFDFLNMNSIDMESSSTFQYPLTVLAPPGDVWHVSSSLQNIGFTQEYLIDTSVTQMADALGLERPFRNVQPWNAPSGAFLAFRPGMSIFKAPFI
ncbi:hypothetical protein BKA70DRAFT_1225325 [Coprinopsis sp. MPI-PUGE-AT-0042]|nr:hypothetical protein BKA70DRAFT_1225325 [Coprinopsis sp. MPI-PUGE-AT-0042]